MKSKITQNGRLNIPKELLEQLFFDSLDEVYIYVKKDHILITRNVLGDKEGRVILPSRRLFINKYNILRIGLADLKSIGLKGTYDISMYHQCIKVC